MKLNKFIFTLCFIIATSSIAQDLDNDFIKSLPADIQNDILNRVNNNDQSLSDNYRPYTYSSKLELEEDLIKLKERLQSDLDKLEKRLNSTDLSVDNELKLFGSDFFNTFQTSFMPINEPNPDSSYVLDVGDILKVQVIGQDNYTNNFSVNSNGTINLPDIGEISIVGLSLGDAIKLIESKIKQTYIGAEAFINLSKLRDVNILITGNAKNPGIYTLSGNSNILHAISIAGGINKYGSYRAINLLRNNEIIETLDIYDLLVDGNYNIKKRLRSGDVIFVESSKNIVTIDGAVKRPGKYEVKNNESLDGVIRYANGFKKTADILNISLERILDGSLKSIPILNKTQFKNIKAEDGDLVYIREFPYREAKISGAVKKPGTYVMTNSETLDDLIEKAGGYNNNAYPFGAIYLNQDAKSINKKANNILYAEFLENIIAAAQRGVGDMDLAPIISLTKEIKEAEPNGRITIDLTDDDPSSLYTISEGDELFIPEMKNNIFVYGEVSSSGSIMYKSDEDVEYYIEKSGGYKNFADLDSVYVLHPNGETEKYIKKRNIFENSPMSDIDIYPGSIIFVPKKLDETTANRLATQAYVSILGNLGIALASLSTINNN